MGQPLSPSSSKPARARISPNSLARNIWRAKRPRRNCESSARRLLISGRNWPNLKRERPNLSARSKRRSPVRPFRFVQSGEERHRCAEKLRGGRAAPLTHHLFARRRARFGRVDRNQEVAAPRPPAARRAPVTTLRALMTALVLVLGSRPIRTSWNARRNSKAPQTLDSIQNQCVLKLPQHFLDHPSQLFPGEFRQAL